MDPLWENKQSGGKMVADDNYFVQGEITKHKLPANLEKTINGVEDITPTQPLKSVGRFAVILVVSLMVGMVLPALIAHWNGVFYSQDLKQKIPSEVRLQLEEYGIWQEETRQKLAQIDEQLNNLLTTNSTGEANDLLELRAFLQQSLSESNPPVILRPLYLHSLMYVFPTLYISLAILIFICNPVPLSPWRYLTPSGKTLMYTLGIYVLFQWPVWMRNALHANDTRIIYSFAHVDISAASFFMQEINFLLFSFLLSVVWRQWSDCYLECQTGLKRMLNDNSLENVLDHRHTKRVSQTYLHWQVSIVILSLGFIVLTSLYWDLVIRIGDSQYILHTVLFHTLWVITIGLISLPLYATWTAWITLRHKSYELMRKEIQDRTQMDAALRGLADVQPINAKNAVFSGTITLISFILPILQSVFK